MPIDLTKTHVNAKCPGYRLTMVELQGWLRHIDGGCNGKDPDLSMEFEPDSRWMADSGFSDEDYNRLLDVGTILARGLQPDKSSGPLNMVATPIIHVEVWGFAASKRPNATPPTSWHTDDQWGESFGGDKYCKGALWPYDVRRPDTNRPRLKEGLYVRIVGSVVSDGAHTLDTGDDDVNLYGRACYAYGVFCSYPEAQRQAAYVIWGGDNGLARWTEIHPPDSIQVLVDHSDTAHAIAPAPRENFRGITLVSDHCSLGTCASSQVDTDIAPPGPRPQGAEVGFTELVSNVPGEFYKDTVEIGNKSHTGAQITVFPDHIHVQIKVRGQTLNGLPGRFKALYRVYWKQAP